MTSCTGEGRVLEGAFTLLGQYRGVLRTRMSGSSMQIFILAVVCEETKKQRKKEEKEENLKNIFVTRVSFTPCLEVRSETP